jgi:hypothetical protein
MDKVIEKIQGLLDRALSDLEKETDRNTRDYYTGKINAYELSIMVIKEEMRKETQE